MLARKSFFLFFFTIPLIQPLEGDGAPLGVELGHAAKDEQNLQKRGNYKYLIKNTKV